MANPKIQMDPLAKDRDPLETLQYAITRERGQDNTKKTSTNNKKKHFTHPTEQQQNFRLLEMRIQIY